MSNQQGFGFLPTLGMLLGYGAVSLLLNSYSAPPTAWYLTATWAVVLSGAAILPYVLILPVALIVTLAWIVIVVVAGSEPVGLAVPGLIAMAACIWLIRQMYSLYAGEQKFLVPFVISVVGLGLGWLLWLPLHAAT